MTEIKKGKSYQGKVEKMVYGGKGIVKISDFVVFVEKALTGQEVEFQITKLHKNYAEGKLKQVLKKAENEIEAKCPHFGECGGCKWQNLPYPAQLKIKEQIVRENIENVVEKGSYIFEEIVPSPQEWTYRNKLDFSFGYQEMRVEINEAGERIYHDLNPCLGFHRPQKFELILPIQNCQIAPTEANQVLNILKRFFAKSDLPVYNPKTHQGFWRNVIVRKGERTGEVLVNIVVNLEKSPLIHPSKYYGERRGLGGVVPKVEEDFSTSSFFAKATNNSGRNDATLELVEELKKVAGIVGILLTNNESWNDSIFGCESEILWGRDFLYDEIGNLKFKISPDAFFQTNSLGAEKLYQTAKEFAKLSGKEKVLDLYCGTGTIGLYLADQAEKIYGIELIPSAIENAKINAELNGIQNAEFICGDIDKSLADLLEKVDSQIDVVILDPPRVGVGKKALQRVLEINAKRIVYVSCNPTTFARDLEILNANGYQLKKARAVDMFPHTHHIEMVALLSSSEFHPL